MIVRPMRWARETEPWIVAVRACSTVRMYSAVAALPPISIVTRRWIRSSHSPDAAVVTSMLPRSSVRNAGLGEMPATCIETCGSSGNARPIPSASRTGKPICVAQQIGSSAFDPPISEDISAITGRPNRSSTISRRRWPSLPLSIFSIETVGAPIMPQGNSNPSGGRSSRVTKVAGPFSSRACNAISRPMCGSPPPPVPRTAAPRAIAWSAGSSSNMVGW